TGRASAWSTAAVACGTGTSAGDDERRRAAEDTGVATAATTLPAIRVACAAATDIHEQRFAGRRRDRRLRVAAATSRFRAVPTVRAAGRAPCFDSELSDTGRNDECRAGLRRAVRG